MVKEANRLLLTDPEKLPKKDRAMWYAGTKRLLKALRRRTP